jgi:hypothetical protein
MILISPSQQQIAPLPQIRDETIRERNRLEQLKQRRLTEVQARRRLIVEKERRKLRFHQALLNKFERPVQPDTSATLAMMTLPTTFGRS